MCLVGIDEVMRVGLKFLPVLPDRRKYVVDHRVGATEDSGRLGIAFELMPLDLRIEGLNGALNVVSVEARVPGEGLVRPA